MADLLCLIPARGGSKTVRRKNLRTVGGKTLVQIAVEACRPHGHVVVSTDDMDIAAVAHMCGAEVQERPPELATDDASIDDLVRNSRLSYQGPLLVYQPTVPQAACVLGAFLNGVKDESAGVAIGSPHPHLVWSRRGLVNRDRGQRQDLSDELYDEIGVRYYPEGCDWVGGVWDSPLPLVDVDTPSDLAQVRAAASSKRILFRMVCNRQVGSGHVRRCVQIADELQHHTIGFTLTGLADVGLAESLSGGYPLVPDDWPRDLCVNDVLDSGDRDMFWLRMRSPVIALEDSGPGAKHASLVINELYPADGNALVGPEWAVLRPVFTAVPEHRFDHDGQPRLLISFGGTDPADLTRRLGRLRSRIGCESIVLPPPGQGKGADLASMLVWADVVVCSGGRTVWEAMACGTPAVVLAQNPRELTHSHLSPGYGVINLGLGQLADDETIVGTLSALVRNPTLLADMSARMRGVVDGKGVLRIAHRIEGLLGGL